ncbi:DUF1569 domain-containing protein [Flavobacterium algicola]|uniref:DUF1569 domain-containing protein n=1 Tax=Flavobacterium algicola TaxID=556529 RepID=UPI001EFCEAB3|nr:DUF1569 domain-containing protein [Flavobacterium algicola]MCG9791039.1 DUF1569 domain-containing protein [Flavobacterium algicola]
MRKNLHNRTDLSEILIRIEYLSINSQHLWGTMDVAQMLSHLNTFLETSLDINHPRRLFLGRLIGPLFKKRYTSTKEFSINRRTHKNYIVTEFRNFEQEKSKAITLLNEFCGGGTVKCTTKPHSFFGYLTPEEWAIVQWKHFDHHLRQFGV